ncbi:NADH dehydrogenase subunit 1 [Tanacetum coccineum]
MDATAPFHRFRITHLPKNLNSKAKVLTGLATIKLEFLNQEVSVGIKTRPSFEVGSDGKERKAISKVMARSASYVKRGAKILSMGSYVAAGPRNSSEIVMDQKQIWSGIPLFPVLVMFFISCLVETNRASFDLPEAGAESVTGYNVEYVRDAILNSSLLAEAKVPGVLGTHFD